MPLLSGCSVFVNAHRQKEPMLAAYMAGKNDETCRAIGEKLEEPGWFNGSVVGSGDEVMWRLEAGSMHFVLGNYKESLDAFRRAEALMDAYDERATVSLRDVSSEGAAALSNLNALPYRGFGRDRVALSIYKSLAYLGEGNEAAFRAQLRRLGDEQKKLQEEFAAFIEAEKEEIARIRRENPNLPSAAVSATPENLGRRKSNETFSRTYSAMRKKSEEGYGLFVNPVSLFLSGLAALRDGNAEGACVYFRELCEAMPASSLAGKYYITALNAARREIPASLNGVVPFAFPLDRNCLHVLFANGRGVALKPVAIQFPVATAWGMCEFYPAPFRALRVHAEGTSFNTELLADMDAVFAREFQARLPGIVTHIVIGTAIKETAYYGGLAVIGASDMNDTAKTLSLLAVAAAGEGYKYAMNTADTRTWELLPKEFQLVSLPMPRTRRVGLDWGNGETAVDLPRECRSAILFVNAPSARNIEIRVLPMNLR